MITDYLLSWFGSAVRWLGGLMSLPAVPSFLGDLAGYVATATSYVAATGSWIPWPLMVTVLGVWGVALLAGLAVKLVRIVASFLSLGGGSAA